jgi:hypothetical protein
VTWQQTRPPAVSATLCPVFSSPPPAIVWSGPHGDTGARKSKTTLCTQAHNRAYMLCWFVYLGGFRFCFVLFYGVGTRVVLLWVWVCVCVCVCICVCVCMRVCVLCCLIFFLSLLVHVFLCVLLLVFFYNKMQEGACIITPESDWQVLCKLCQMNRDCYRIIQSHENSVTSGQEKLWTWVTIKHIFSKSDNTFDCIFELITWDEIATYCWTWWLQMAA